MAMNETVVRGSEKAFADAARYGRDVLRVPAAKGRMLAASLRSALSTLVEIDGVSITDNELKALLARVSDAMLEGVVVCGPRGEIVFLNDNLCVMLGRTLD